MKSTQNLDPESEWDSTLLLQQARTARAKYIGELLATACNATVIKIRAGRIRIAAGLALIISAIIVVAK